MKIAVVGKEEKAVKRLKLDFAMLGYLVVSKNPDLVISYGGDGSFLFAERKYPGVPKIITRNKSICNKCIDLEASQLSSHVHSKKFKIVEINKLNVVVKRKGKKIEEKLASSDVTIRNLEQFHAIRFNLFFDNAQVDGELVGDGIVVANSFGSTGYFYAITKKDFKKGIGVALNNTMTKEDKYVFQNKKKIKLVLNRNPAGLSVDNDSKILKLVPGDVVEIRESKEKLKILKI